MKMTMTVLAAGLALGVSLLGTATTASADGRHRSCQVGPAGWHYHTLRGVRVAYENRVPLVGSYFTTARMSPMFPS